MVLGILVFFKLSLTHRSHANIIDIMILNIANCLKNVLFTWKAYKAQWHQSRESVLKDHCKVISKEVYNPRITVTFYYRNIKLVFPQK